MTVLTTHGFADYALLDSGEGYRLERYGDYVLSRPDPQCIWKKSHRELWGKADAVYEKDGWKVKTDVPDRWLLSYEDISFYARLTPFKHTGVFPEQMLQWEFMKSKIQSHNSQREDTEVKVLNLFGYTGIASVVCAKEGVQITHVDASRPSIAWARENMEASHLTERPVRWILDDAVKFCEREARRSHTYDGIIMDPPIYGHGPTGERWDFFEHAPHLFDIATSLLSMNALFFVVNAYAISASSLMLENLLQERLANRDGVVESGELALQEKDSHRLLSTGIFARWSASSL
jgi:23S rRNA (cytosine1962-C5)-methyltransferase